MANRWGNNGNGDRFYFGGAPKSLQMVIEAIKLKVPGGPLVKNLPSDARDSVWLIPDQEAKLPDASEQLSYAHSSLGVKADAMSCSLSATQSAVLLQNLASDR